MKRTVAGRFGRFMILAAAPFVLSCASAPKPGPEPDTVVQDRIESDHQWEQATRDFADDLMAEAQRLKAEGRGEEALSLTDDAMCLVLQVPSGYSPGARYLAYLAELVNEADDLEASLQPVDNELQGADELVLPPPVDLFVNDDVTVEEEIDTILPESDFPLEINSTVERFLEAMASEGEYRQRVEVGLSRAGTYLPMIRSRFSAAGLPEDLSYLPLIESAFSVSAYSRARAVGMWQFISSTGRHYGLDVGSLIDERRDPERSTDAAIAYLTDLHNEFDDWYLALAAYNSGAGNVRRAMRRSGSRDFWALRKYLPRETRNYVPAFIASVIVAKRPEKYGFVPPSEEMWVFDSLGVPDALDLDFLARESGIPLDDLRQLNPAIRRDLTPARSTTTLRLPSGTSDAARAVLDSTPREQWAPRMIHTVRSGDSLYAIARRYGSSVSAIRQANSLRGSLIRPGQSLIVPRFGNEIPTASSRAPMTADGGIYVVQRNDTLWDIARGFSTSVESLCEANGLSQRDVIKPGQRLSIPDGSPNTTVRTSSRHEPADGATYTVRSGDTLYDIARAHDVSVTELKRANGLASSRIHPGTKLRIPPASVRSSAPASARVALEPGMYTVQRGDTLYDIARRFGVSISELRQVNGLRTSRIYPGDVLRIPTSQAKS